MTIFFTPQQAATSGWQKVGSTISLTTITDVVLIGLSTTDLSAPVVCKPSIYAVSASSNAIVCGFSTLGEVASIVSTATGTAIAQPLLFYVPTERMRITTAGLVGINTTTPTSLLHIVSGANGDILKVDRTAGPNYAVNLSTTLATIGVSTNHPLNILTNNTSAIYIDTSQKVGIGTSTPSIRLEVIDAGGIQMALKKTTGGSSLEFGKGTDDAYIYVAGGSGKLQLGGAGSLTLTMLNTGLVGIQQPNPSYTLDINGTLRSTGLTYLATGAFNVNIGTTTDQGFKLYVTGTTRLDGVTTFTNTLTSTDLTKQISFGLLKVGSSATIDASAALEILSTTTGLLLPRMTTAQRDAISSPTAGLVVYNSTTGKLNVRTGAGWEAVTSV